MGNHLLIDLVYSASLLLVMVAIYSGIRFKVPFGSALPSRGRDVLTGVLVGLMGIALMLNPWMLRPGIFFDARSVLLGVAGLFFGFVPTALAVVVTGAYRLIVDGPGALSGLAVILGCAGCGLAWRRLRPRLAIDGGFLELYLFGVTVHLVQLACILILPWPLALELLLKAALPLIIIFPLGTVLLSVLLIHQRKSRDTEEGLMESEARFRALFENSNDAIFLNGMGADGRPGKFTEVNRGACESLGYSRDELLGLTPMDIDTGGMFEARAAVLERMVSTGQMVFDTEHAAKDGRRISVEISGRLFEYGGKRYALTIARDITGRKAAEREKSALQAQLLQSQKMEAIGRLAGGVAHDFNNILTAINYYGGVIVKSYPPGDPGAADAQEILAASKRAETLTRQLLTFSRRQVVVPKVLDLNKTIADMVKMLKGLIGDDVFLETRLSGEPCLVMADAGQLEQLVMNLAVNARDAMPGGGTITMTSELLSPDAGFAAAHPELRRGRLVKLTARDTGHGMTPEVRNHIFEPFFTTKPAGRGTGLGLSTILGIVKQSGGEIEVESAPGKGAAFFVYLPLAAPVTQQAETPVEKPVSLSGTETVLLVEDDRMLRRLGERLLRESGYTVLSAADGADALQALEGYGRPVDLLITDVVMPGMNGRELGLEVARRGLAARTLYMSGYTDEAIAKHGVLEPGLAFIYKPFTADALALKLREILEGPADRAKA
ncbi:MAG: hypothetical protein A2X31_12995 [Elusimicrobia bacterium GWB2_63_22]|nr:MAG: hypothetical protein A2X31_12995 [Elusimicrobia bacterium GWB2_63_22]